MPPRQARERANTPGGNVECAKGAPLVAFGGVEFMQGMFIAIEKVVRNIVQAMQVPIRAVDKRATTTMKAFLQLRLLTFWGKLDPLIVEDWLEQVTRALDTILVMEEDLRSALIRVNSRYSLSRGDSPTVRLRSSHRVEVHLLATSVVKLAMHTEEKQSRSDKFSATYAVSSSLEGHPNIYVGSVFLLVYTTSFGSVGLEDLGVSLYDDINSWTFRDNRAVRAPN
ncbi:DNA-binding protein like [Actinidia chinensis var. chinensis]|uniref:DNA-binding protein like n=1 Tax=Actinidia chinensis var. chinensis TaxID=1590841 RepID=A0A2R6QHC9_ACTCC|nr:DNA-binding protein like [Actinidia chinensis var. chinensis]